jgi:hypothetical protein
MNNFAESFNIFGPPAVIGAHLVLTVVLAVSRRGLVRWLSLFIIPAAALAVLVFMLNILKPFVHEGSGFLIGGAIMGFYLVFLFYIYYPLLALAGIIIFIRSRIKTPAESEPNEKTSH